MSLRPIRPAEFAHRRGRKRADNLEEVEQRILATWLDFHEVLWCHVPNGGHRHPAVAAKLKSQGVKRGVPDVLIFEAPSGHSGVGVAIELKRTKGGRATDEQKLWMESLSKQGWRCFVANGADQAISVLVELGYGKTAR